MNREDFPILEKKINGKQLIYFDSAATALTPTPVILAMQDYYENYNANVHRGSSSLGQTATTAYEKSRDIIAKFIGAKRTETIFTKNCSESLNVAARIVCEQLTVGDEIICPVSEHHSNFVVWQQLAKKHDLVFTVLPVGQDGKITLDMMQAAITEKTKVVTFAHVSNVLGVIQPVQALAALLHKKNIIVVVDGAQGIVHERVDVKKLAVDFYTFSSHKLLGPTGLGVLYGKEELLAAATPVCYGGEMIAHVSKMTSTWNELPWKFEAGTPAIAQVIGLATAVVYFQNNMDADYLYHLTEYTRAKLESIPGLTLYGTATERVSVFSFTIKNIHAMDLAHLLNAEGIQIREGHHCAQPLLEHLGVKSLARVSLLSYNTIEEVDFFIATLQKIITKLK